MNNYKDKKIIVIVGTTASGKTKLAVGLAVRFNGEIVSADSRQVYRGLDIGTGKDLKDFRVKVKNKIIDIRYHLIDIANPKQRFDLAKYQKLAYKTIDDILARGKLPIIVGGTGLYVQAIVDGFNLFDCQPDKQLRKKLEKKDVGRLFKMLFKLNPKFAVKINDSDKKNKRRLIRYIEIASRGRACPYPCERLNPELNRWATARVAPAKVYQPLIIGATWPKEILHQRINDRLIARLEKENMAGEVEKLHNDGVSWKRLESFGLEYKFISWYLQEKISYEEMAEKLFIAIKKFAKRQMTWWRRWEKQGRAIEWTNDLKSAEILVKKFLK